MPTNDHNTLFSQPEYVAQFEAKKEFENGNHRLKLSRVAARHETHTPWGYARIGSGYYKDLSITADGKLAGMTR